MKANVDYMNRYELGRSILYATFFSPFLSKHTKGSVDEAMRFITQKNPIEVTGGINTHTFRQMVKAHPFRFGFGLIIAPIALPVTTFEITARHVNKRVSIDRILSLFKAIGSFIKSFSSESSNTKHPKIRDVKMIDVKAPSNNTQVNTAESSIFAAVGNTAEHKAERPRRASVKVS